MSDRPVQLGALDLGSNSFHLLIAQESSDRIQVLDKHKEMVRLAAGLDQHNHLSEDAQNRALECLGRFAQRLRSLDPENIRVVGTNTLRRADSPDFLQRAEAILGHRIEIISGREEARLIYLGVCHDLGTYDDRRLVVDIGGGSTEIVLGRRFKPEHLESLYIGCVSTTQRHFTDGRITQKFMKAAKNDALVELEPVAAQFTDTGWDGAVGTSGTINAVHDVLAALQSGDGGITREGLELLTARLVDFGEISNINLDGLADERKAVFPGGVAILSAIFQALDIHSMSTSQTALREGLIFDLMGRQHQEDARDQTVQHLIERYNIDRVHARQVRETTIGLLSQVARNWALTDPDCKHMISWAASLHEIGMEISHSGYHKHGAYLLENMDMPGFSRSDQAGLATLVRNHRRKLVIESYDEHNPTLLRLTILLRLAAVLHRNRSHAALPHVEASIQKDKLTLNFPSGWLDAHPLTVLDLENEAAFLAQAGIRLITD